MRQIILSSGNKTLVDDNLYQELSKYNWCEASGYATRQVVINKVKRCLLLHYLVLAYHNISVPKHLLVDHENRNKLDNQYTNLRIVTNSQNIFNQDLTVLNTSGFKGVSWHTRDNKWVAKIKQNHLGYFDNIEDAIAVRENAEKNLKVHDFTSYVGGKR